MSVRHWRSLRSRILRRAVLSSLLASAFGVATTANAASLFWDGAITGAAGGGSGVWDTVALNTAWWNGAANVAWNNAGNDIAVFGGATGGTVTVGAPVTANSIQFSATTDTTGYSLLGTSPLTLTTGNVTVDSGVSASMASTVLGNSQVLNKLGTGTLTLTNTGVSLRTAATNVSSGTLAFGLTGTTVNPLGTGAINLSGGTLELSPVGTTSQGLSGRQLASTISDTARIDFTQTAASTRIDNTIDTTAITAGQAVQWIGKLNITTAGAYTFQAAADDGIRLFIDGVLLVQNDGPKGEQAGTSSAVTLSAGQHDVRIDYVNSGGSGAARFRYSGPDNSNTMGIVPVTALRQAESNAVGGASNAVVVGTGIGNDLNVSGSSAINLKGTAFTQTQVGNTTFANGSTLSLSTLNTAASVANTGKALRIGGTATFGTGVTLDLVGDGINTTAADLYIDGALSDGGVATTITKSGAGRLTLSNTTSANNLLAASSFNVSNGTLQLVGSSAGGAFNPIGSAGVTLSGGNLILDSKIGSLTASTTFANAINVTENGTIQDIVSGGSLVTLSGPINVAATKTLTLDAIKGGSPATSLGAALILSGPLSGSGNVNLASTGYGTLNITPVNGTFTFTGNNAGFTGNTIVPTGLAVNFNNVNAATNVTLGGGTANYLSDGNGTGQNENLNFADDVTLTAASSITVNRLGTTFAPLSTTPTNKTVLLGALNSTGSALTVNNNNGYGVNFQGTTTLSGPQTITVSTATSSSPGLVQGLTLSGKVTGTSDITKAGAGTMVLTNATNDFVGNIAVTGGVLGAASDAALGNSANTITLNGATGMFEAFGTFATNRTFVFSNATTGNNLIGVTSGNTLTIDSQLTGVNGFQKGDPGILILTNNTSNISGGITASGGVLRITKDNALGITSALTVAGNEGTAFQIDGSGGAVNFARPVSLGASSGIENNGALQNFAGSNTVSGAVTLTGGATIGNSAGGTTLSLTGGISGGQALTFNGAGNISVNTTAIGAMTSITRNGSGSTNISVANPLFVTAMTVNQGNLTLSGAGTVGTGAVATTVTSGGSFVLDNSTTAVNFRLNSAGAASTRTMALSAGTFQFIGGSTAVTETLGALASNWGGNTLRVDPGSAASTLTFASVGAVGGGSTLVFQSGNGTGTAFGTANNQVVFTALPTLTNGIMQRAVMLDANGINFVTQPAAASSVTAFTAYNNTNNLVTAATTDTMRLTSSANISASRTLNALAISGNVTANSAGLGTLTLTSGNILVQSGNATIGSNLQLAFGGTEGGLLVAPGSTLNINAPISNSNNVTTGLGGTINFNTRQFFNTGTNYLTINGGTVKLAGGNNTLYSGQTTGANQNLAVGPGATLDLNGNVQVAGDLRNPNSLAFGGAGGIVTTTGGAAMIVSRQANSNWSGVISGPVTFAMGNTTAANVERFYENNSYTGKTGVFGGTLELTDNGRLSGTTGIDLNYGTLNILNTSANNGRMNLPDRVNDAATITSRGGFILLAGRAQSASTETLGTVDLAQGTTNLNVTNGGTGINSSVLTIGNLTRSNTDATVNLNGAAGQLGSASRLIISSRETTPGLTNNILGGWAVNGGADFLSYIPGNGLAALNAGGYAGYNGTTLPAASDPTSNIKLAAAANVGAGGLNLNSLIINGNVTFTNASDTLNLTSGGLLKSAGASNSIGATANSGNLTAGGPGATGTQSLYIHNNAAAANTLVVNSAIVDNGAAPVRLVATGYNLGLVVLNGTNTYTGGTAINGWQGSGGNTQGITLGATGTLPAGGLTINNGLFSQTAGGVIAAQPVTLNGSSTLTLAGNNTLTSLTINNNGGTANGAVNTGGVLTLTNSISATSNNVSTLPVINGTIDFGGTPRTLSISPIQYDGRTLTSLQPTLNIAGVVQNAGLLTVAGGGKLQLSGQSTFTGGVTVDTSTAGTGLVIGASSTPTAGTFTSGPLGTGTLTTQAGATLLASTAASLANPVVIQGNLNFDGITNLTLNGPVTMPGGAITIDVAAPQMTASLLGAMGGTPTAVTKTGYGTLALGVGAGLSSVTLPTGGPLSLLDDGDGTGTANTIAAPAISVGAGSALALTVGRSGVDFAPYYTTASNKTFVLSSLALSGDLTINNNNGYGVNVTAPFALANDPQVFNVATASASNVTQGLTLSDVVSGAGGITKQGAGALVLANAGNTFGGSGKLIDVQAGVVAVNSDSALGNSNNNIRLGVTGTAGTLRAAGTFTTARTITLNNTSSVIEVTGGNTLTLSSAFGGTSATTQLVKSDNGTLVLNAANPGTWSGSITAAGGTAQVLTGGLAVNAGVVRITDPGALGASTNIIAVTATQGAAVEIGGGITVTNPLVLNTQTTNGYAGGINWGGALRSVGAGVTNTWSGPISENQDAGITADLNNTLNLTGGINLNVHIGVFGGAGTINVTSGAITSVHTLDKIGSGVVNLQSSVATPSSGGLRVFAGELKLSGAAGAVVAPAAAAPATIINPGATLTLDNGGAALNNRLGGSFRPITLQGGNLNLIGGATTTTETTGAATFNRGQSTITVTDGGAGTNLAFAAVNNVSPAQNNATAPSGATVLFRGTSLGAAAGPGVSSITSTAWTFNGSGTGAAGTTTKAILPWALVDTSLIGVGTSFATASTATSVLRPLDPSEYNSTTTLTANTNMLISTAIAAAPTSNVNSITFDPSGSLALGSTNGVGNTLNVSSGGILVRNGVTTTISGGILNATAGFSPYSIHTPGTAALTISSLLHGGNGANPGLIKAGAGTLTLSTPTSTIGGLTALSANTTNWQTVVNQGTLVLNGGLNTLGTNNYLAVNPGGTLDLNGNSQFALGLFSDGATNGIANSVTAGGTVTNTSLTPATLVTNTDNRNWAGQITGNVFYNKAGTGVTTIYTPQTYAGGTLINVGEMRLRDYGTLANTPSIDLNYATLTLDNAQAAGISGRLGTAALNLRGATFNFSGRAQTASTETLGALSIVEGINSINVTAGGTGVNSSEVTFASLSRPAGSAGVVNFGAITGTNPANGQLGSTARIYFTTAPTLTNNIIAPWAFSIREWETYIPGLGVAQLNATGAPGYAANTLTGTPLATDNIKLGGNATLTADTTINTLNLSVGASATIDLGTKQLTLQGGGLMLAPNNTATLAVNNGTVTSGYANGAINDLYLNFLPYAGTNRVATIGAAVTDNGVTPVRLIVTSSEASGSAQSVTLNGTNTYTGGTVGNLGTIVVGSTGVIPAGGITLNSTTLSSAIAGQVTPGSINSANTVTLNSSSVLNLAGNQTLAGLVFNNNGGSAGPIVNSFVAGANITPTETGRGTLTLTGPAAIVANSSSVTTNSVINGRLSTGAGATLTINPIIVNGVAVSPLQPTLGIQSWVNSAGTIVKTGTGVLQLNAQQVFTGTLDVQQGGIGFGSLGNTGLAGGNAAGSRYSRVNLAANTFMNLTNTDATIGSLSGSGTVFNANTTSSAVPSGRTLNVGFDGTSSTFSGSFARYSDAFISAYQVNKIGAGTMTLTGASTVTNNLQVSQGGVTFSGAGTATFNNVLVGPTGTLTLDNSGSNVNNRLGGPFQAGTTATATVLGIVGGEVRLLGNSSANTTETVGSLTFNTGTNPGGSSTLTLVAGAGQQLTLNTNNTLSGLSGPVTALIRGVSAAPGAGLATVNIGTAGLGAPTGAGTGANGTLTMPIRPDMLGDASATGLGTGFITKDSVNNTLRPLTAAEMSGAATVFGGASNASTNYGLSSAVNIGGFVQMGSLTLNSGGGLNTRTSLMPSSAMDGLPINPQIVSGGILAMPGNTGLTAGRLQTANNTAFYIHTLGNLTLNATLNGTTGGLTKADGGTLTLGSRNLYTGQTNVNGGTLRLAGGDNTLPAFVTAGAPTLQPVGIHSAGVLDLNGNSQLVGTLFTNGIARYDSSGGTVTNTSATTANLTTNPGTAFVFGGKLEGNLNFNKVGGTALSLASVNNYTGTTNVRGSSLTLIDAGSLSNTSAVNLNYGTLAIDQSGLNPLGNVNPQRVPAATPINLSGGTVSLNAGGSMDSSATFNTVNVNQGNSTLTMGTTGVTAGSTATMNIGNLVLNPDATLTLIGGNSGTGFFSNVPGLGTSQMFITSINGTAIPANISNKILPANILINNGEFATYIQPSTTGNNGTNWGVMTLNGNGASGAQSQYDSNAATLPASNATWNVRLATTAAGTVNLPGTAGSPGTTSYNALAFRGVASTVVGFVNTTDVLNLSSGGLALTQNAPTIGGAANSGIITSSYNPGDGTNRLFVHSSGSTINSVIADNGATPVRLVANSTAGTLTLAGTNTYTGGTVVNGGGTVALAATGVLPAGGVTLNGSILTATTAANQIASANSVTLNGSSTLTLGAFANTLNRLSFSNIGGTTNPSVAIGTGTLALTDTNSISAVNDNAATLPVISGNALLLPTGGTITTSTTANVPNSLSITAPITITSGPVTKAGGGSLHLAPTTAAITVTNTSGTPTLTTTNTQGLTNGQTITGTGIPAGTTILSINPGVSITLSANTTAAVTSATVTGSTFAGGVNLNAGTIILGANSTPTTVGAAVTSGPLGTGTLTMADQTGLISDGTLRTIANNLALSGASPSTIYFGSSAGVANVSTLAGNGVVINGTVDLGAATRTINVNSLLNVSTINGVISGASTTGLTKAGSGQLTLTAVNTFDGPVTINGGILTANVPGALGTGTGVGNITFGGGLLQHGGTNTTDYSSRFSTANNQPFNIDTVGNNITYSTALQSTGGSISKFGTASLILQAAPSYTSDTNIIGGTLQFGTAGTSTGTFNIASTGLYNAGTFFFNPATATDKVAFAGGNGTGATTINNGIVEFSANANYTGALTFGNAAGVATGASLLLNTGSATYAAMTVQNNASNSVVIGSGQSLTNTGNFTMGSTVSTNRTSMTVSGAGSWIVNNTGGTFRIGVGPTPTNSASESILNASGLATFTANLGSAGSLTVGAVSDNQGAVTGNPFRTDFLLASTSTINAGTVTVGASASGNVAGVVGLNSNALLQLGSTANTINANTLNIGTGARDAGTIKFGGATGTLMLRDFAGTGPVNMNMGTGGATTGNTGANVFDTTGHIADLLFGTVIMGNQSRNGAYSNTLSFDQGNLSIANLQMALRSSSGGTDGGAGKVVTSTVNIGGGAVDIGSGAATIMSQISTGPTFTGSTSNSTINITGGTVNFAATAGVSINMSSAITAHTANSTLNFLGGTTTINGDIIRGGGAGTTTALFNLDGGTLNMTGKKIGGSLVANNLTSLTFASGTLNNVGEINNGASLIKTTIGTLNMTGPSTYTGRTIVNNGVLTFDSIGNVGAVSSALGAPALANATIDIGDAATGATISYVGTSNGVSDRTLNMAGTTGGATVLANGTGTINFTSPVVTTTGLGNKAFTLGGSNTGNNTIGGVIPNSTGFTTALVKTDPGKWVLGAVNTYSGTTTVNEGTLVVSSVLGLANNSSAHVLMAVPDNTLAGNPLLTRAIGTGLNAYAGFGSQVTATSIDPISLTALQTTADILMSGNNAVANDMSMQWRFRTAAEANVANTNAVLSDVVSITGMGSDIFVLQMNYTDTALGSLNEASIALSGELRLGWNNAGNWVTATAGNSSVGGSAIPNYQGSWASFVSANSVTPSNLNNFLGSYGVDPTGSGGVVWAILDHNSEFAVIPEPSTLVLGGLALLGLAGMNIRRRRMQKTQA